VEVHPRKIQGRARGRHRRDRRQLQHPLIPPTSGSVFNSLTLSAKGFLPSTLQGKASKKKLKS
jgi:hypothetical protein